jgi:hypothetical protein
MKSYMKMCDKLLVLILCVWYWDVTWCLGGLAWRQTPSRFSGWWQLGCQPGSQVVSKHQLGAPRLCWAKNPNKRGWPIITGLWLATAWVLGRAGHSHLSKHTLISRRLRALAWLELGPRDALQFSTSLEPGARLGRPFCIAHAMGQALWPVQAIEHGRLASGEPGCIGTRQPITP